MVLVVETITTLPRCNSNNHLEYAPFYRDGGKILIEERLYCDYNLGPIFERFRHLEVECMTKIKVPHENQGHEDWHQAIYHHVVGFFHHLNYVDVFKIPGQTLTLKKSDRDVLSRLAKIRGLIGRPLKEDDLEDLSTQLHDDIDRTLQSFPDGSFVKMSRKSSKNDGILKRCISFFDVINVITSSLDIFINYQETEYIVFKAWMTFNPQHEYRVFIIGGRIKAISQQLWYEPTTCQHQPGDILALLESRFAKVPLIGRFSLCTLDVIVDVAMNTCYLIEVNPPGLWASSGSSLYHWIDDYEKLFTPDGNIYFRHYVHT